MPSRVTVEIVQVHAEIVWRLAVSDFQSQIVIDIETFDTEGVKSISSVNEQQIVDMQRLKSVIVTLLVLIRLQDGLATPVHAVSTGEQLVSSDEYTRLCF